MTETLSPAEVMALMKPTRSKYNVDNSPAGKAARTLDGVLYASKAEADYAAQLKIMQKAGVIEYWFRQVRVPLYVNNFIVGSMILDFMVENPDGTRRYVDVKGVTTPEWDLKRRVCSRPARD